MTGIATEARRHPSATSVALRASRDKRSKEAKRQGGKEARRQEARRIGHEARKQGDLPAAGRHPSTTRVVLRASLRRRASRSGQAETHEARRQGARSKKQEDKGSAAEAGATEEGSVAMAAIPFLSICDRGHRYWSQLPDI